MSLFGSEGEFEILPVQDGKLEFWPRFIEADECSELWNILYQQTAWRQSTIKIAGRLRKIPRLNAWHGEAPYGYSGVCFDPAPWTPALLDLKQRIEAVTGASFNSVLLNLYRDGNDSVGWHADNERELGRAPVIASLSLGAARIFQLKHRRQRQLLKLPLTDGSLLLMGGSLQVHWLHQIPKQPGIREPRINCTFRRIFH